MSANVILLTPARRFIANRFGLGYQIPLGMVLLGGPLLDAGFNVTLIDNDVYGWNSKQLIHKITPLQPDYILIGHTGSTAAHTTCLDTAVSLKAAFPQLIIIYGGVYPSYAAKSTLQTCAAVDFIVRGEGEETAVDLLNTLLNKGNLADVQGIVWRENGRVCSTPKRPPIQNLDAFRPGWELVDWEQYTLFGVGRAAGIQFSRGCPLTCTYCGQWLFWKKWRHRSPANFVEQLTILANKYDVKIVWLADENFGADRAVTQELLERIIAADLDLSLNINMTAADIVRDADLLPLYKQAGVDYVVMGVEALDDAVIGQIRKNNPFQVSKEAVRLLHENKIISLVNIIYGLEDETPRTIRHKFRKLLELDGDILNAVYLTPHFWTKDGRNTNPANIIQPDLKKWTYRNQIIQTPYLSPALLFAAVKLTEVLFHLRPSSLKRLVCGGDKRVRQILRASMKVGVRVLLAEVGEFLWDTPFTAVGHLTHLPDTTPKPLLPSHPTMTLGTNAHNADLAK